MQRMGEGWNVSLSREESFRLQYRMRPYLERATDGDLTQRIDDIVRNVLAFTPEAKIGMLTPESGGEVWGQKIIDVHLEVGRRRKEITQFGRFEEMPWSNQALQYLAARPDLNRL